MNNEHSKYFEKYQQRYNNGGCTKAQLRRLVELGILTVSEYEEITSESFDGEETEE